MSSVMESTKRTGAADNDEGGAELAYESLSTRIYRRSDKNNSLGGRTGFVAIKLLSNARPDPKDITSLYDEYILSRTPRVSRCAAIRSALKHTKHDGYHAIYLEWATGVTLREWIRVSRGEPPFSQRCGVSALCHALRLAWRIAGAVSEVHNAGIVHNNLNADNVIVDTRRVDSDILGIGTDDGSIDFTVKIIDLGSASLLKEDDPSGSIHATRSDLFALGVLLYELLSGLHPVCLLGGSGEQNNDERDEMRESSPKPLHELGSSESPSWIPISVSKLVSSLMMRREGTDGVVQYMCARDVEQDIDQMIEFPERFLTDIDLDKSEHCLEFPEERLYGRHTELSMLLNACLRKLSPKGRSEMVLIYGPSGTGKSSLVHNVRGPLIKQLGCIFLSGKFDQLSHNGPLSAVVGAFEGYFEKVVDSGLESLFETRAALQERVGPQGIQILTGLIPSLQQFIGGSCSASAKVGGMESQNRLKHVFRLFVRAIASTSHPLVLFLDDLQWADVASIGLIQTLVTDNESRSFLFIGCYRDNEVDGAHPLSVHLRSIEEQNVPITKIKVDSLSRDSMNCLISDTLYAPRSSTKLLTSTVYSKTNGNIFFAILFLKSLFDEGLIYFSSSSASWQWNINRIKSKSGADNALQLMSVKILNLSADVRGALQMAACLGSNCEEDTLHLITDEGIDTKDMIDTDRHSGDSKITCLVELLDVAVDHGLMTKTGTKYRFGHDLIQRAAYTLLTKGEQGSVHLRIGTRIWKRSSPAKLEELLFVAVDQLNLGSMYIAPDDEIELARLNLRAGKKAMSLSLFSPAAVYLKAGISLLGRCRWADSYGLSLQLYDSGAEAEYCNGNFDEMDGMLAEIFSHTISFEDKLSAYHTLINSLGARSRLQEATKAGFLVLEQLGEPFPDLEADINADIVSIYSQEYVRTRVMLEEYTDETLVTRGVMEDERKLAAMHFLKVLTMYSRLAKQDYLPLLGFRMMQLSLRYGLCEDSAFAFAVYGVISCKFGDTTRGYQFGQMALNLLGRFEGKESQARVISVVYGGINHWSDHIRLSLEPLLRGYQLGMKFGDTQYAAGNANIYCMSSFQCGKPLPLLEDEMSALCEKMAKCRQETYLALTLTTRQTVQNLRGRSDDPLQLTGAVMNEEQMLHNAIIQKNLALVCNLHLHRLWLAYYFCDYRLAAESAEKSRNVDEVCAKRFDETTHAFLDGLTSLVLWRKTRQSKWRSFADEALEKMKNWAVHAPCNFQHKVRLLEAEFAFVNEDFGGAARAYDMAISLAGENGFLHEQALACERAATFHFEIDDRPRASDYRDQALDLYLEWGALGKANQLRGQSLSFLIDDAS